MTLINVDFLSLCAVSIITYTFIKFLYMTPDITKMPSNNEPLNPITNGLSYNLIIARYNESLEWLNRSNYINQFNTIKCYNKGDNIPYCPDKKCKIIPLPNIGRCDHTFLYHIINNYNNLANLTVFLPASCLDHHKIKTTYKLMYLVDKTQTTVFLGKPYNNVREQLGRLFINRHVATNEVNQKANPETQLLPCPIRPFGRWYDAMFGDIVAKIVCYFGVFAVAKEHIIQHPIEKYERLIKYVNNSSNPEAGHYMERSWGAIFYPYPESCIYNAGTLEILKVALENIKKYL